MITAATPAVRAPRVGQCLRAALRDVYDESSRLIVLNGALSAYVLAVLAVAIYIPLALVLLLGAGPLLAGLVRAAVTIVEEGSLSFADAFAGYRRTWRRGLQLIVVLAAAATVSAVAIVFYGGGGAFAWPLAVLVAYLGGIFALHQLLLWPLACREPERPLREVAREAAVLLVRRPAAAVGLGVTLLVVNLLALLLGALLFLTLSIAYSALAAARFALGEE